MSRRVVILGGAGFIGSNLAQRFVDAGDEVTVIDGLLDRTGGRKAHLAPLLPRICFLEARIEDVSELGELAAHSDLIVDCMAWTAHRLALKEPGYDLLLNVQSHLSFLTAIPERSPALFVYLGSRCQYGKPVVAEIVEGTEMLPNDIQGIHKLTGEHYYRVYAALKTLNAVSLRIPNCFGPNQPLTGPDIGLVGSFIRDALARRTLEIFGRRRRRSLLYVKDLAKYIFRLSFHSFEGFHAFNIRGHDVLIEELVRLIVSLTDTGLCVTAELPESLRAIDQGNATIDESRLVGVLGELPQTDLKDALTTTIRYMQENSHDLAL